jgi:PTS system cellobiose-specific IIA component
MALNDKQARLRAERDSMATEEETLEANQETAFQIIATVGSAKSQYIEAIQKAKDGDIAGAKALIESGNKDFNEGHTAHLSLLQQSAIDNKNVTFSLILVHAEDQLMQAESFRIIAEDFIDVYEKIESKN